MWSELSRCSGLYAVVPYNIRWEYGMVVQLPLDSVRILDQHPNGILQHTCTYTYTMDSSDKLLQNDQGVTFPLPDDFEQQCREEYGGQDDLNDRAARAIHGYRRLIKLKYHH
eukprot:scaffold1717_cov169-Amphora_coffeaeformis.AAC.11